MFGTCSINAEVAYIHLVVRLVMTIADFVVAVSAPRALWVKKKGDEPSQTAVPTHPSGTTW